MKKQKDIHTISIFVANKPGVLVRCAQVFARRAYNIDALVVSPAVNEKFSRMTITAQGDPATLEQIIKQTAKLVDVLHVTEHTGDDSVNREYTLFKIKCTTRQLDKAKKLINKRAHIIDHTNEALIIGQVGTTEEIDALEKELIKEFKVLEMIRSGKLVMAQGQDET